MLARQPKRTSPATMMKMARRKMGQIYPPGINMFFTLKEPPMDMFPDVLRYREDVRRWKRASATVFDHVWKRGTQEERTAVCLLQIHKLMAHIMLAGAFCITQTAYDQFFPEYQKIMELVEYIYPHLVEAKHGEPLYRFDLGIIIAMFLVGVRYRDKATRDSSAHLPNLNKEYREGMWDTGSAGAIVSRLREIEDGMRGENGEIAEENRAFVAEAHLDLPHRRGIIKLSQRSNEGVVYERRSSLGDGSEKERKIKQKSDPIQSINKRISSLSPPKIY